MLESMRNAAKGAVGKAIMTIVMGLIIISFVIWGVGDMLRGFTTSTVASVGGAKISAQEYRIVYQRTLQQYQRRLRRPFTNEEAREIGLDRSVLQRLLSEAAIDEETRKLGLDISDDALRDMITSNPNFRNKAGAFDPELFATALRDMDMNERGFVSEMRKQSLRQFIVAALTTGIAAPKAEVKAEADYEGQTRSVDYFLLPASAAGEIPAPSEDALKAFYNDRKSSYRAPEYRAMNVLALEPARTRGLARRKSATCSRSCFPTRRTPTRPRPSSRPGPASTTSSRSGALSRKTRTSARRPRTQCSTGRRPTPSSRCRREASVA